MLWSQWASHLYCFSNAALYVLSLYMIPTKIRKLPRENKLNMKYRLTAASMATVVSVIVFVMLLPTSEVLGISSIEAIGLRIDSALTSILVTSLMMAVFYFGPLACATQYSYISLHYTVKVDGTLVPAEKPELPLHLLYSWGRSLLHQHGGLVFFRNIVFAPVTEEVVFRAVMLPSMCMAAVGASLATGTAHHSPYSPTWIAMCSPLWFGVAHLHHFADKSRQGMPLIQNAVSTLVQLAYTSVFGVVAALLFMRTGNILAPVASHVICNLVGLPDIGFVHPPAAADGRSSEYSCMHRYRYVHLGLHAGGLAAFALLLFPLTEGLAAQSPLWRPAALQ